MKVSHIAMLALVAIPAATGAPATPLHSDAAADVAQLAELAARKGTRNYRAGEGTPAPVVAPPAEAGKATTDSPSRADKLTQCMDTWDAGTHITKSKWREICRRQLNEQ